MAKRETIDFNDEKQFEKVLKDAKNSDKGNIIANITGFVMRHPKKLIFGLIYVLICGLVINVKWVYLLILKMV